MLPPSQAGRLDVVLVSPRNPLNIGAAARAMANFGFRRLSIVAPFAHNWMEAKSAVGAPDLLREARVYDTLAEAVAQCTLIVGTGSLDRRKPEQNILDLPAAAELIRKVLDSATPKQEALHREMPNLSKSDHPIERGPKRPPHVALLIGSEKHGLTSEDLSWCHAIAVIDTCDQQPSMNLGQAVAVCLYEISRNPISGTADATFSSIPSQTGLTALENSLLGQIAPPSEQLDRLARLVEETMEAVNYATRGMRSANGEALRVLLRRLMPNDADLRRMMGLFRRILWQMRRPGGQS